MITRALLILLSLAGASLGAQERPLTVSGVRALVFGTVLPGIPRTVPRTDPVNGGEFNIKGPKFGNVQITFSLPGAMAGPGGATLPLSFVGSVAGFSASQSIGSQVGFDPQQTFAGQLSKNGRASVYIGGTAQPQASQRAGGYTAILTMSVTIL